MEHRKKRLFSQKTSTLGSRGKGSQAELSLCKQIIMSLLHMHQLFRSECVTEINKMEP